MNREHTFYVVALMEPFPKKGLIERYKRRLNMETTYTNINGQIWLFFDAMVEWELVEDTEKQATVRVFYYDLGQHMMMTFVYAKCSAIERLDLWDHLYYLESDMELPWLVGGDFNVLFHKDEKIGGLPVHPPEYEDFAFCNILPTIEVEHLIRTGSDHAPLLMTCGVQTTKFVKPFRFLNFWTKHATFMDVVRQNWEADFIGDQFLMFKQNIKRVKAALSKWNRETFGDIFKQLAILEDIVRVKEIKKLQLKRIKSGSGVWIEDQEQLATTAVDFYQKQFTNEGDASEFPLLNNVPSMVTMDQNLELSRLPTIEEVRASVFELSGESTSGPDGFTSLFYQTCCDVIGADIHNMEIITDIRLRGKPANVVIKLDMAKAYDRISWKYLLHMLRKMRFSEHFINMVWNLMSNNWSLNKLFEDKLFVGFGMPKWSDSLNHLAYADDAIIFASANAPSLSKIMAVLGNYEKISGQMINKDKSSYYMYSKVANGLFQAVGAITGFGRGKFPFTYLGCPMFYTRRRKVYYEELIKKVKAKLHSWKGKLLSFGRKATLISSVLQSMPVHILSVLDQPNSILGHLHKTFARTTKSLWSNFMWNKYCKKEPPTVVRFRGGSHVWRQMLNAREEVEHEIVWELKSGTTNIWHENWTGLGALYHVLPEDFLINEDYKALVVCSVLSEIKATISSGTSYHHLGVVKGRNAGKHGGSMSTNRVIYEINRTLHQLGRVRYDWIPNIPLLWPDMIQYFEGYKPILITTRVTWQLPCHGWYKCNIDEASKGNPGPSSLGFCVRDDEGDVVYARAVDLGVTTNVVAEAKAILQGLEYCVEHDFHPFILETDSLVMKKAIEREWDPPWALVGKDLSLQDHKKAQAGLCLAKSS
ncbi:uncharacterized protein [Nicotiana tomentosiformis]|uniref:uncharacterized protein n=1 Tax=Nicotiana tomentosiformis TaxID=4098 RepID=UPI00388C556F